MSTLVTIINVVIVVQKLGRISVYMRNMPTVIKLESEFEMDDMSVNL